MGWNEVRKQALDLLHDVDRGRVEASEPGVELAYLDWGGDGEPIIFHHANGFCAATFAKIAAELCRTFRVVAFDARGHGDSTSVAPGARAAAYGWSTLAADYASGVSSWLGKSGYERVRLAVGHSFGGTLTLAAAHALPGRIEQTLLLDPVLYSPDHLKRQAAKPGGHPLAAGARRRRSRFPDRSAAFDHFVGRGLFADFAPETLALYVEEGFRETDDGEVELKCTPSVEAAVFEGAGSLDIAALVSEIHTETDFIHAARGNFSRAVYDDLADRMPRASVESLDVGHLMALEEPGRIADLILGILERRAAERG